MHAYGDLLLSSYVPSASFSTQLLLPLSFFHLKAVADNVQYITTLKEGSPLILYIPRSRLIISFTSKPLYLTHVIIKFTPIRLVVKLILCL